MNPPDGLAEGYPYAEGLRVWLGIQAEIVY